MNYRESTYGLASRFCSLACLLEKCSRVNSKSEGSIMPRPLLIFAAWALALSHVALSISLTPPSTLYSSLISSKLQKTSASYKGTYPQVTDHASPAHWVLISPNSWTTGFFPATMYELHRRQTICPQYSDGVDWLSLGRKWSLGEVPLEAGNGQGHDQGFLSFPFVAELAV